MTSTLTIAGASSRLRGLPMAISYTHSGAGDECVQISQAFGAVDVFAPAVGNADFADDNFMDSPPRPGQPI